MKTSAQTQRPDLSSALSDVTNILKFLSNIIGEYAFQPGKEECGSVDMNIAEFRGLYSLHKMLAERLEEANPWAESVMEDAE